eukprot:TRINITY_DN24447_c0_g1_i1.p1 TRINITY_DN24447_c0_g1~~TRINITY_DN24447_c0_g1_i1.p1  ORF type:complete len:268 (+),score=42.85 TRINITY_DN24447_c0_g1_i1:335-1138(+)
MLYGAHGSRHAEKVSAASTARSADLWAERSTGVLQVPDAEQKAAGGRTEIESLARSAAWTQALSLTLQLLRQSSEVDEKGYRRLLQACSKGSAWATAADLLSIAEPAAVPMRTLTRIFNGALSAGARAVRGWLQVVDLLAKMAREFVEKDTVSCNAAAACSQDGGEAWRSARRALGELAAQALEADRITYMTALKSTGRGYAGWQKACMILGSLRERAAEADAVHSCDLPKVSLHVHASEAGLSRKTAIVSRPGPTFSRRAVPWHCK